MARQGFIEMCIAIRNSASTFKDSGPSLSLDDIIAEHSILVSHFVLYSQSKDNYVVKCTITVQS